MAPLLIIKYLLSTLLLSIASQAHYLSSPHLLIDPQQQQQQQQQQLLSPQPQPPVITPFAFNTNVQENQRSSVLCTVSSGDLLGLSISWLKDGQPISPTMEKLRRITIKPDTDQSTLKFASVRLEHAGNYTCVAKNRAGVQAQSAQLVVQAAPRWLREPDHEPIVATRGQTVIIDCQSTGWPRPQQVWQVKNYTQLQFEPIMQTSRISLAPNGSLVIRNADKSDEANYLCEAKNGIGNGISWSTSLKVTVPAHFESNKQQMSVVRKQNNVQLRCDAYGDEPITIEWFKNKQRLTNELDSRYSIHNKPLQNGLISLLLIKQTQRQDNSIYECVTRNPVGKDRLPIELLVQEEPDNIQELQVTQINSRSVTLMWTEPYDGRSSIMNYMFQYKKIQENSPLLLSDSDFIDQTSSSLSDTVSLLNNAKLPTTTTADDWQQASRITLPVQQQQQSSSNSTGSIKSITIEKLDPSTKYVLRALAVNAIGQSRFSQPLEFNTQEEAPETGPTNIRAVAINSTSIQVSWDEIPKSKQLGRIHGYYIGHRAAVSTGGATAVNGSSANLQQQQQQSFVYTPFVINDLVLQQQQVSTMLDASTQRLETVIHDLRRDTSYEITVVAFNSRGSGPSSSFVFCKTIEMEPPKPVRLQIRRELNESIYLEWTRDPSDQNPVDDYTLYQEKNSASQELAQIRLPGNQTHYRASSLKCGTRYQYYIIAKNKVGSSQPSEVVSGSTSGALPVIPSKTSLIRMINSTCLSVNLNSFQDNSCRIRTFTVRYRVEKSSTPNISQLTNPNGIASIHQALSGATATASAGNHQALNSAGKLMAAQNSPVIATSSPEWLTIRPKSNSKAHQRASEEDRMEYMCDLNPTGEYTIHVAATNDVGRSEIEYTVLMSSDELRHSAIKDLLEFIAGLPNVFAYVPSILVFLLAGLFLSLVSIMLYTTIVKYYQKFVIMQNQIRATRRAKQDEKRRRKLNNSRHSQKLDLWADEYEEEEEGDGDDEEDEDDSSAGSGNAIQRPHQYANQANGHYLSNIANSAFDTSSIDSPCNSNNNNLNKFNGSSCISTASNDSIHGRFQCLNSKQYVKMNEYTMLPSVSASITPTNDIYGTTTGQPSTANPNNSLYYSTLRRTSMQTYLPQQRQQQQQSQMQQQQHRRRSQNVSDIYGYYMAPQATESPSSHAAQHAANEAANSIFVPPQQIIYSAPNIRRQPVFL